MIKPFLLKCHPDVQPNASSKKVNLTAIQNLNSYMDTLQTIALGNYNPKQHSARIVEIEFVLQIEQGSRGVQSNKNQPKSSGSRRRIELLMPPVGLSRQLNAVGACW